MSDLVFCVEITGESSFHNSLNQSGWGGKDYRFIYNRLTNSHLRAYRSLDLYLADRMDMHKASNVWPLMFNMYPADKISESCYTTKAPVKMVEPEPEPEQSNEIPAREFLQRRPFNSVLKIAKDLGCNTDSITDRDELLDLIDAKRGELV